MRLKDRIAVVTGGGIGIGQAFCRGLAAEGAKVIIADIDTAAAEATAKEIVAAGNEALSVPTDVADEADVANLARTIAEHFGATDILVNNAALFSALGPGRPWHEIEVGEWDRVMQVNLRGMFLVTRALYPLMKGSSRGRIINISSATAYKGWPNRLHYVTSKAGVLGFTRALARELSGGTTTVNTIAIGSTLSEGVLARGDMDPATVERIKTQRCVQQAMYPEDIVGTLVFLASDDSKFVCGETIVVDGGIVFV
jgi:3-oxoacyl-[acyl-carrier protein] reductase